MKAEFSDAYRMRNSVLIVMIACMLVVAMGMTYSIMGLAGWVRYVWANCDRIGTMNMPTNMDGTGYEL